MEFKKCIALFMLHYGPDLCSCNQHVAIQYNNDQVQANTRFVQFTVSKPMDLPFL